MKIVADENMPLVRELFAVFGEVITVPGRQICPALVADADVLLVRSVTRVDSHLLTNSRVGFVGTATIGTDHVDVPWLASRDIPWASAPGCNAAAVADYVIAALCAVEPAWLQQRIGIVGCGNVGAGLYRRLADLGVDVVCYDPFLDRDSGLPLMGFSEVLDADILCLHTPLTRDGPYPTWHLFDEGVLAQLKPGTLLLNAGRGEVIDNSALSQALDDGRVRAVLDVWEGEPAIDIRLLGKVVLGTPHIAGYSLEGRLRGSLMIYDALRHWAGEGTAVELSSLLALHSGTVAASPAPLHAATPHLASLVLSAYDPRKDFSAMRQSFQSWPQASAGQSAEAGASTVFDHLRKHYPWRREFSHFSLPDDLDPTLHRQLLAMGFADRDAAC